MTTESNFNGIYRLLNLNILPYISTVTLEDFQEMIARGEESPPDVVVAKLDPTCAFGTCSDEDLLKRLCEALRLGAGGIEREPNQPVPFGPYPSSMPKFPPPPCPEALKNALGTKCNGLDGCIRVLIERLTADFMHRWNLMSPFEDLGGENLGQINTAIELLKRLNKLARRITCKETNALEGLAKPEEVEQLAKCLVKKGASKSPAELKQILDEVVFQEDEIRWLARHVHRGWDPLLRWARDNLSPEQLSEELKKINRTLNPAQYPPVLPGKPNTPPPAVVPSGHVPIPGLRDPPPWAYPGYPHSGQD